MYIYRKTIFKSTSEITGVDVAQNSADKTDFETTYKSQATPVSDIVVAETSFVVDKTWAQFKALIDGTVRVWADVKYIEGDKAYSINLITETLL